VISHNAETEFTQFDIQSQGGKMMHITYFLENHAFSRPDQVAFKFNDNTYTFQEWNHAVNRLSRGLMDKGVKKGDHIALMMRNSDNFFIAFLAILKIGGVTVPVNFRLTANELEFILNDSESTLLLFQKDYLPLIQEVEDKLPKINTFVIDTTDKVKAPYIRLNDLMEGQAVENPNIEIAENDWAEILYTAGTTGNPKGAIHTHHSVLWTGLNMIGLTHLDQRDHLIHVAPLFHCGQLNLWMISGLLVGCYNIIVEQFDPIGCLEMIEKEKISLFHGPPTMFQLMTQAPQFENTDISSLKRCTYGGAPITAGAVQEVVRAFSKRGCNQFYNLTGMTEMGPSGIVLHPEDQLRKAGMSGKNPMISTKVRVVDDEGRDVKPGEVGEFILSSETMMQGYYNRPEATAEVIRDGWYYSGDLAFVDDDGYIRLVDRKRDMIITGAENVYTLEVENVLSENPKIADAVVFGVPNEIWGEVVMAAVVVRPNETLTREELEAFCRQKLAGYKIPRIVEFTDSLPRNPAGKILKRLLKEQYNEIGRDFKGPGKYVNS
jgi:acyl-CoA synthetase (AMP-forming)/AMP-acid ligase II